jgi:putative ABC transport system permease protein
LSRASTPYCVSSQQDVDGQDNKPCHDDAAENSANPKHEFPPMNLFTLAIRNLRRRPVRTGLVTIGIAVAVGCALTLLALARGIQDGAREGLTEIGGDLIVMPKNWSGLFGGFIPDSAFQRLSAIPGVVQVSGALVKFAPTATSNVLAYGWPDGSDLWKKVPLRQGRVPAAGESRVAVLGDAVAATLGKKLNDDLDLFGQTFRIVGIANYASSINRGAVMVPLADLQEVSYRPHQVTIVHVGVGDVGRRELARISDAVQAPGDVIAAPAAEVLDHGRNFTILEAMSLAVAVIAALISALNVITALVMATQERTREIGILSAIGWSGGRIMKSVVAEGVVLWAIGCALGVALSVAAAYAAPYVPVIGRLISIRPGAALIAPVVGAALVLSALGALVPAWRAARMLPAEALRR